MPSIGRLAMVVCCAWALALLYGEMVAYWLPLWTCSWPHQKMDDEVRKVAVLADPQLMDKTSLRLPPGSFLLEVAQFYTDIYMRRSFRGSILPFKPDVVLFLGDLFDGGPFLSDQEWQKSLTRFRHIFGLNGLSEPGKVSGIPTYYLSGNHDIGYASIHSLHPEIITRFEKEFGARNYHFSIGNVEFIAIDAQTLDGPKKAQETSLSWDFIKNISNDVTSYPRVLLTHIPLYRPNGTPCGPFRSSLVINQRVSHASPDQLLMYQNYLTKKTSDLLLELIKPVLVLSGHDHDQCTVTHSTLLGSVTEHTLGTLSWQQGNLYPSFMLLSVTSLTSSNATNSGSTVSTHLCFLPMQTHIYVWYLVQLVVTLLLFIIWPTNGFGFGCCWMSFVRAIRNNLLYTTSKVKDEEENCEYEMIWDAEGSMHIVKKTSMKGVAAKSEVRLTGRGDVVARPSVKKHIIQEQETLVWVDMGAEAKLDSTGRLAQLNKSRSRRLIQRLIRVFRLVVIVAAVNIPIYVMLLFKDWI